MQHCRNHGNLALAWARYCQSNGSSAAREARRLQHLPPHHARCCLAFGPAVIHESSLTGVCTCPRVVAHISRLVHTDDILLGC